jgi:Uma2 family endonuclease
VTESTSTKLITADELLAMGDIGRCELIYGELVMMSPAGFTHGEVASRIGRLIGNFVEDNDLGVTLGAETGYILARNPDLVRAPDVSVVQKGRLPGGPLNKFFPGAPDLTVEVVSPDDTMREVSDKADLWVAHGAVSAWVVDPNSQTVTIHRRGMQPINLGIPDDLRDDPAIPGFVLAVSKIFRRP